MNSVKQLSVFVEDKPGMMNKLTEVLAANSINMRALSLAETEGFGIVRIIAPDVYDASTILTDAGYINKLVPVVVVEIPDVPGGLNKVLNVFTKESLNVKYMYAVSEAKTDKAYMVFRVEGHKAAQAALAREGFKMLEQEDIESL